MWKHHVKMVIEGPHIRMMEMTMEMTWMIYPTNPEITVSRQKQWMSRTSLANPWSQSKIGSFLCCFFFFFWSEIHIMKINHLSFTIQWHSQCCPIPISNSNISLTPEESPAPMRQSLPILPCAQPLATTIAFCLYGFTYLYISYKRNHNT